MQTRHGLRTLISLMLIRALALSAFAQEPVASPAAAGHAGAVAGKGHRFSGGAGRGFRGFNGFQSKLEHALGLTPEQREAVHGLLAQQHEELRVLREASEPKYAAVQEQTDAKIRALLNPEQQKKFDVLVAQQKESRSARRRRTS